MSTIGQSTSNLRGACIVCREAAHGQHFGVLSCRPCAAFFRRCCIEKCAYRCLRGTNNCNIRIQGMRNGCKSCRLQLCQLVGMTYKPFKDTLDSSTSDQHVENLQPAGTANSSGLSNLEKLTAAYRKLISEQRYMFYALHPEMKFLSILPIVPKNGEHLLMEQGNKTLFLAMLNDAIDPFKQMGQESKIDLLEECFCRLDLLHLSYLSLEQFTDQKYNRSVTATGEILRSRQILNVSKDETPEQVNELQYIVRLVKAHHRIWGAFTEMPDQFMNKFGSFADLFISSENILGYCDSFTADPSPLNEREKANFLRELGELGAVQKHPRVQKAIVVFKLISVGIAKAMPVFDQLALEDQIALARNLAQPLNFLFNGYYSAQLGCNTWANPDGLTAMDLYHAIPLYRNDTRLMRWAEKSLNRSVEHFLRNPLPCLEEFALLLGILFSHAAIVDLSDHARRLLYMEQIRYSKQLFKMLQIRLGPAGGAARFAICIQMVENAFYSAHNIQLFMTYLEAVHLRQQYISPMPEGMRRIIA